ETLSVTVTVTDSGSPPLSDSRTFTIDVANVAPTVTAGGDGSATAGAVFARNGSFTDPGTSDSWTATVNYGDQSGDQPLTLNSDKTFALSHVYASAGSYPVKVTVTDAGNGQGTVTFTLTVAPAPPDRPRILGLTVLDHPAPGRLSIAVDF